jgi:NADPH-dependent curcumin reductase CurA
VLLRRRPHGLPVAADFELVTEAIPVPADGEMVIRNEYCSLDPAIRGWMDDVPSYMPPIPLGAPIRASTYGRVVSSRATGFAEGDHVIGLNAIEEFSVSSAAGFTTRVDPAAASSPTHFLGIFGAVGLTAYFGVFDVAQPKPGETVLVSGAAGAVGSLVGQLARLHGCRAVGIAGGPVKCRRLLEEYGFDAAIDYRGRDAAALSAAIAEACPNGVDVFFDNVGGVTLEAALAQMNSFGRIAVCGMISQYNAAGPVPGPSNLWQLIAKSVTMRGFVVRDFLPRFAEGAAAMMALVRDGKLVFHEHIDAGIENFLPAFLRLFEGTNDGKLLLRLN